MISKIRVSGLLNQFRFYLIAAIASLSLVCSAVDPPDNPILVIANESEFGLYLGEILKTEGFNEFQIESPDDAGITLSYLENFDIVILSEFTLRAGQTTMFTSYVSGGGNLIAIKPDKQLADIFGITDATGTIENGYLRIDATTDIGNGLLTNTLQLHCSADRYNLNAASKVATLYLNSTTPTNYPGIVFNNYGLGHAIAFSYNLAKNIVYTRQGNYEYAGLERDGIDGIRAMDLFTDDWLNTSNNIINQADEQMRTLTHCIEILTAYKKPLPRLWYFPDDLKCLVTLTSDSENNSESDYSGMFNDIEAKGANMTLYTLIPSEFSKSTTDSWTSSGHEIAGHPDDSEEASSPEWTDMNSALEDMVSEIFTRFGLQTKTSSNHYFVWCGNDINGNQNFAAQALLDANNGLEMDLNYAHYDNFSNQDHFLGPFGTDQGNFTGSGLIMKFSNLDGNIIDTYQHLINVYDQQYSENDDATGFYNSFKGLMDRSLNNEVYSYISIKAHRSIYPFSQSSLSDMLDYANENGIPVWTALKLLDFTKMKNEASFNNISWSNNQLSFQLNSSLSHSNGLTFMVPAVIDGNNISYITINGSNYTFTLSNVKGVIYALCTVDGGTNYDVVVSTVPGGDPIPVTGVTLTPPTANVSINGTQQLTGTVLPINATNKSVTWSSSNTGVATVSSGGLVTGVAVGSATITVTTQDGNYTATSAITVASVPTTFTVLTTQVPAGSEVDNSCELGMKFRSSQAGLITKIRYYRPAAETGSHIGRLWSSTETLLASASFTGETSSGWQEVTLSTPFAILANTTYVVSVNSNNSYVYTINGLQAAITNGPLSSIPGANGIFTYSAGSFPDESYQNTNYFRDITFTTSFVNVTSVSVSPTTATLNIGGTQQLTETVLPANATNKSVTWSSSNTAVATVSTSGLVRAVAVGSATITVTTQDGNYTAASVITVAAIPVTSVSVSPPAATLSIGGTQQLTATVLPANATNKSVTWMSSNTAVATVSTSGLVTADAIGAATITVTTVDGNFTATSEITVATIPVTSVSVSPTTATLSIGGTQQLTATVLPANAGNKSVTWSSSNTAIATVSTSGLVTAVAVGSATITVTTVDGNFTATSEITVANIPVTSVSVSPTTATLNIGGTQQLTATVLPANATNKSVTWSSSNSAVASVSTSGLVTAVAVGSATITVTTMDGNFTASCGVTVASVPTTFTVFTTQVPAGSEVDNSCELGMKFRSSQAGLITKIRYNRPAAETGSHVGRLWSSTGTLLASASFTGETSSGWQEVTLSAPYAILANTTYVVSVNSNNSYVFTTNGLQTAITNGPLSSIAGSNGVFIYTAGSFPNESYQNTNYFRDITFTSTVVNVTSVSVSPTTATLNIGGTQQLTATVLPANATNKSVTWSSSNSAVASVSTSGLVTAVAVGSATITVTTQDGNYTATSVITVATIPVTSVSVSPPAATLSIGGTQQLTATVLPANATNKSVTWMSSNTAVATVSTSGLVTADAIGTATITVTTVDGNFTAASEITVATIPVTSVSVSPTTANLSIGGTQQLTATVLPANAGNKSVTWSSSNTAVATVSTNGLVTAVAVGSATITVTTVDGNFTATCEITVANIPVTSVSVSPTTAILNIGGTQQLTAMVLPANATNKSVTWSSSNSAVATVSTSGLVTAVAVGSATITVTTMDGNFTASCGVTVASVPTTFTVLTTQVPAGSEVDNSCELGMKFRSSQAGLITKIRYNRPAAETGSHVGRLWSSTGTLLASASFTGETSSGWQEVTLSAPYAILANTTYVVSVNSNNSYVFTTNGLQTAITNGPLSSIAGSNGVFIYTAGSFPNQSYQNTNYFRDITFTSTVVNVTSVSVSPTTATLNIGGTQQLTETVLPANATNKSVTWSSSNTAVATVSTSGLVTAVAVGSATITVTTQDGNYTAASVITVAAIPVTSVSVSPPAATLSIGGTQQFTATVLPANATNKSVTWMSSNTSVATVSTSGLVTAGAIGTATITVTTVDGNFTATSEITVATIPVTSVSVSPTTANLSIGGTQQLTATVLPANATNKSVTWSSSNTAVATVSTNGLVTAVAVGSATITVTTVDGNFTATCEITVANIPVTSVSVSPTTATLNIGGTQQLTATVLPANATNKSVIWSSSNSAVATVSTSGLVTAVAVGSATITVTTMDGNFTASCGVTVASVPTTFTVLTTQVPAGSEVDNSCELGMKFRSSQAGLITKIRYNRPAAETGSHVGRLWSSTGTLLASASFTGETSSGWQEVTLSAPYSILANTTYVVSVNSNNSYVFTTNGLQTAITNGPLSSIAGSNGVYIYTAGSFPNQSYQNTNYFRDVTFSTTVVNVTSVTVSPTAATISIGGTQQLTETVLPANATNKSVTWSSSNTAVATVSTSGLVTAVAVGSATITVTTQDGNYTATSVITVATIPVTSVSVSPTAATLSIGGTQQLTATVLPANATNKSVTWMSSNTAVATVSTSGLVTAVAIGSATITVTTVDGNFTATSEITVATIPVTSVSVSPTTTTIGIGGTQQVTATVLPVNASNKTVTWSSSNTAVATVSTGGLVTGVAVGSATITVTTQDGNYTASCAVTVDAETITTYTVLTTQVPISSEVDNSCELGMKFTSTRAGQIIKIRFYKPASESGSHVGRLWSATGTLLASATFSGETSSGWQEVILNTPYTILANTTYVVSVNSNNSYVYTTNGLQSAITNGPLSSIAGSNGVFIYTVGAFPNQAYNNCNYFRDVTFSTVTVHVISVSVNPTTANIGIGGTQQLIATVLPTDAANKNVTWTSSNTDVATVSTTGLVSGVAPGSATITVTTQDGNFTATSLITVAAIPVTSVSVSPTTSTIVIGGTRQLTATVLPANATNKSVTWSSSNAAVATVNSSGLVTGIAAGSATITVTTQDGNFTASCEITVTDQGVNNSNKALVIVNSTSQYYSDYVDYISPYLDNFGIPYDLCNINTTPLPELNNYAVLIFGHRNVYQTGYPISQLESAISGGVGLYSFDPHLFDYSSGFNTLIAQTNVDASTIEISNVAHYITQYHVPDSYDPNYNVISLLSSWEVVQNSTLVNGVNLVTVGSGAQTIPLMQVSNYGTGKIVKWCGYDWVFENTLGPVYGMDDLLWRGIVWAARKPFIMQGLPPMITMRMDDATGTGTNVEVGFEWLQIANEFGIIPWCGTFNDDIPQSNIPILKSFLDNNLATASPHAFGEHDFIYFNHNNIIDPPFDAAEHVRIARDFYIQNGLKLSKYVVPHYYEMSSDALPELQASGIEFLAINMLPDNPYNSGGPWLNCAPYRINRQGIAEAIRPVYYGGYVNLNGIEFFNCLVEIRDDGGYEWYPDNDVTNTTARGIRHLRRSINSMVLPSLFSHEYYLSLITATNWREILRQITSSMSYYNPEYTSTDYAAQYIRAKSNIRITNVLETLYDIEISYSGSNDMDTKCYLFTEQGGEINYRYVVLPQINGSGNVIELK